PVGFMGQYQLSFVRDPDQVKLIRLFVFIQWPDPAILLYVSRQRTLPFSVNVYSHVHCLAPGWATAGKVRFHFPTISCSSDMCRGSADRSNPLIRVPSRPGSRS